MKGGKRKWIVLGALWVLLTPWFGTIGTIMVLRDGEREFFGATEVRSAHWDVESYRLRACISGAWSHEETPSEVQFDVLIPRDAEAAAEADKNISYSNSYRDIYIVPRSGCDDIGMASNVYRGKKEHVYSLEYAPEGTTEAIYATDDPRGSNYLKFFFAEEQEVIYWSINLRPRPLEISTFEKVRRITVAFLLDLIVGPLIWISVFFSGGH